MPSGVASVEDILESVCAKRGSLFTGAAAATAAKPSSLFFPLPPLPETGNVLGLY